MKILLIEDDRGIALALSQALPDYDVDVAFDGVSGISKVTANDYSAIFLDLNLPGMSGLEVCKQLRHQGCLLPIIILSCEAKILSKINLLDAGADDYITKPFSLGELKVRLRVQLRKIASTRATLSKIIVDDLILDSDRHTVERAGNQIKLRRKEFALLECLMQRSGSVVSRQILCNHAWDQNEEPWTNTIDVHIKYLRDKIDRPFARPLIKTVHGLGYKIEASPLEPVTSEEVKVGAITLTGIE